MSGNINIKEGWQVFICITIYSPALETLREVLYHKFWWHRIILLSPGQELYAVQYTVHVTTLQITQPYYSETQQ